MADDIVIHFITEKDSGSSLILPFKISISLARFPCYSFFWTFRPCSSLILFSTMHMFGMTTERTRELWVDVACSKLLSVSMDGKTCSSKLYTNFIYFCLGSQMSVILKRNTDLFAMCVSSVLLCDCLPVLCPHNCNFCSFHLK